MKNETKKTIWDSRVLWVIISVVVSILMWVYVTTSYGDTIVQEFESVKIEFRGEDILLEKDGLVISNISANTVSFKLRGSRRELSKLNSSNIIGLVDVSKLNKGGNYTQLIIPEYPVSVDPSAIDVVSSQPQSVYFYVDKAITKSVEVKGEFVGSVIEGFAAGKLSFDPGTITVTGPQTELEKIDHAWVSIQREDVDKTLEFDSEYVLRDSYNMPLTLSNVKADSDMVLVTLPITSTKEVQLTVDLVNGAGATSENVKITVDPQTIVIAGDAKTLEGINKISIGTVDLASFVSTFEDKFQIMLDNDVTNVTGLTEAKVTLEIFGLETKRFSVTNIFLTNIPAGRDAKLVTKAIDVILRGTPEVIKNIKSNNIRAVVDLSEIGSTTGAHQPTAKITVDGYTGVGAIKERGEYTVYVDIY